jgi:autophagy-related protein 18
MKILAVRMNRKRLAVVLEESIYLYDISNMKLLHTIETSSNPHGTAPLYPYEANTRSAVRPLPKLRQQLHGLPPAV